MQHYNDLETINPLLAKEWNYSKNGGLLPVDVKANSDEKVWWKCDKGHEWQATVGSRNSGGHKCPYCSGRYAIQGENDLQTLYPDLANEWDYEKNGGLTPIDVLPHSDKKVWWKCKKGHEWETQIKHRTRGSGCPYCAGRKVWKGFNDLQTVNPTLAIEWNHEKNNGLSPSDVTPGSHKKIWWKCKNGHEWISPVYLRSASAICPECAKQKRKKKNT